jgi:hypothetical protein
MRAPARLEIEVSTCMRLAHLWFRGFGGNCGQGSAPSRMSNRTHPTGRSKQSREADKACIGAAG